jgi:hypothetical protein
MRGIIFNLGIESLDELEITFPLAQCIPIILVEYTRDIPSLQFAETSDHHATRRQCPVEQKQPKKGAKAAKGERGRGKLRTSAWKEGLWGD